MKLLLIDRKYVRTAVNEEKRTVEAWIQTTNEYGKIAIKDIFSYELNYAHTHMTTHEASVLGLLTPVEWLGVKEPYRAKAVCSPDDTWDPKIGVEIAYFRLCRRYLRLLKRLVLKKFYTILDCHSDYFDDFSKGDLCVYLPWGNARHTETEIFIDQRLKALYRKGGAGQPQKANVKKEKPLRCPFCRRTNVKVRSDTRDWWVQCMYCYASGPKMESYEEAVKVWNK